MSSGLQQISLALSYAALRAIGTIRLTSSPKHSILRPTMSQNNNSQDSAEFQSALSALDLAVSASMLGRFMVVDLHDEPLRYLASIEIGRGLISQGYNAASDFFWVLPSQRSSESASSGSVLSNSRTGRRTESSPDSSNVDANNSENPDIHENLAHNSDHSANSDSSSNEGV